MLHTSGNGTKNCIHKRLTGLLIALVFLFTSCQPVLAGETPLYQEIESFPVTKGVIYEGKTLFTSGGWQKIHVLKVDLNSQYIDIDTLIGKDGLSARASLSNMVSESGAVAGINGDFFLMTTPSAPIGGQVSKGKLVSSPSNRKDMASFGLTTDGIPQLLRMEFSGRVIAPDGSSFQIGGINKIGNEYSKIFVFTPDFGKTTPAITDANDATFVLVIGGKVSQMFTGKSANIPVNGFVLMAKDEAAGFLKMHFNEGDYVDLDLEVTPDISNLKMALGGGAILLENGQIPASFTHNVTGTAPRTAVGFSADKKTLFLVVVDGRQAQSRGMSQKEMAEIMQKLGASDALNLDGGGSSTMVVRPLGEKQTSVINRVSEGVQRLIANGIGIFTKAPQGKVNGLKILAKSFNVPKGGSRSFEVRAYDENFNPVDIEQSRIKWTVSGELGAFEGNVLKSKKSGYGQVSASFDGITATQDIMVMQDPKALAIIPDKIQLDPQSDTSFEVFVTDVLGYKAPVEPTDITWQVTGNIGAFNDGTFEAGTAFAGGAVTAAFSGLKATALVQVGQDSQLLENFEKGEGKYFSSYPTTVTGNFSLSSKPEPVYSGSFAGRLAYDFSIGDVTRAAYINFENNLDLPPGTQKLALWVYGQGQGHWLRGTVLDASGQEYNIDFCKEINWSGWQKVEASMPKGQQPFALKRIYLVEIEPTNKDSGVIYIDDLTASVASSFDYSLIPPQPLYLDRANAKVPGTFSFGAFGDVLASDSYNLAHKKTFDMVTSLFNQKKTALNIIAGIPKTGSILDQPLVDSLKKYKATGSGYATFEQNGVFFIMLDSSKGGLRVTDYNQWLKLQKDLQSLTDKTKIVFVALDRAPEKFSDSLEGELLKKVLSDCVRNKGVDIWLLCGGAESFDSRMENGIHLISLPGVNSKQPAATLFTMADGKVYYQVVPIVEKIEIGNRGIKKGVPSKLDIYGVSPTGNKVPLTYPYAVDWKLSSDHYGSFDKNTLTFNAVKTGEINITVTTGNSSSTFTLGIVDITVNVNGKEVVFPDQQPYINANQRTMVPVRFISESLGALVHWDYNTKTVTIKGTEDLIKLKMGDNKALVNDKTVTFDTQAELKNDRVMVPLRFVSEVLGANVIWNNNTRTVEITK